MIGCGRALGTVRGGCGGGGGWVKRRYLGGQIREISSTAHGPWIVAGNLPYEAVLSRIVGKSAGSMGQGSNRVEDFGFNTGLSRAASYAWSPDSQCDL
jgi:hypothetical protein